MREYVAHQSIKRQKCDSTKERAAFYDQPLPSYDSFFRTSCAVFKKK